MPKKKEQLSQAEQSKRFREEVKRLINAGELSPTDAEKRFEKVVDDLLRKEIE